LCPIKLMRKNCGWAAVLFARSITINSKIFAE